MTDYFDVGAPIHLFSGFGDIFQEKYRQAFLIC